MSDNEYWIRFWSIVAVVIVIFIISVALSSGLSDVNEEQLTVSEMKTLLDSGYVKKEIGCYKPMYSFVKDSK